MIYSLLAHTRTKNQVKNVCRYSASDCCFSFLILLLFLLVFLLWCWCYRFHFECSFRSACSSMRIFFNFYINKTSFFASLAFLPFVWSYITFACTLIITLVWKYFCLIAIIWFYELFKLNIRRMCCVSTRIYLILIWNANARDNVPN